MEFGNILVPVGGSEADADSIGLACRLAKEGDGGKIVVVHVISMGRTLPLDAEVEAEIGKAEDVLARAEVLARDQDCQIETDLLQAREIAPAIVDEAVERQIGLILLGDELVSDGVPHLQRGSRWFAVGNCCKLLSKLSSVDMCNS